MSRSESLAVWVLTCVAAFRNAIDPDLLGSLIGPPWQSGADINAKDMLKMTALHWAAEHRHRDVAELLLKYGADVHAFSKFDKTPFDIAADHQDCDLMLLLQVSLQASPGAAHVQAVGHVVLSRGDYSRV